MATAWEKRDDETDAWYANFVVYLGIGHSRTLGRAYKLVHPDSEAAEVSAAWREEFGARKWRSRATAWDLTLFQEQSRETVVLIGRGMRAFARKTLRSLLSKEPAMKPATWEEAAKAFEVLLRMMPPEMVRSFCQGERAEGEGGTPDEPPDLLPREQLPQRP